jgi:glutathione reductase (NADPH)
MTAYDYDLFVIGGGSGGVRAARIAAGHGVKVALAEEYRLGGTCVIRGCVPKKLLVYASRFRDEFEDAAGFGWTVGEPTFDWPSLIRAKDREIARLEGLYRQTLERAGVEIFASRAELANRHTVRIAKSGTMVTAAKILVATGGKPSLGDAIEGREHVITSDDAFNLPKLPRRIAIYGGGYIALEFASLFNGLGSEVSIIYRGDLILRGFDDDLRRDLAAAVAARGIKLVTRRQVRRIEKTKADVIAHLDDGSAIAADQVMFAIGREPNSTSLGLDGIGVERSWAGHIVVDPSSRSGADNIFALGDVTDRLNLTPTAIREGHAFADSEFGTNPWIAEHTLVPTAVFSTPELAAVGYTEAEARERCGDVHIYKARFRPLRNTLSGRDERMLMKLVVEAATDRVMGCHILGNDAAEIVQMAAIAIRMEATKADFDATVALHPTVAEELVTMREKWVAPAEAAG